MSGIHFTWNSLKCFTEVENHKRSESCEIQNIKNKTVCVFVCVSEKNRTSQYMKYEISFIRRKHYYFKCCLLPINNFPHVGQWNVTFFI